ncbi:MAG: hypothetical protein RDV41_11055 [Planctomycetota bacterium]|nr:hypothetical protein [Planctomycetota bacterium]
MTEEQLSYEDFIRKAIVTLRTPGYKGMHTVFSGFNNAFKEYFKGDDPVQVTTRLAKEGKIGIRPVKGGVMLYLPEDMPKPGPSGDDALRKMGLK